MYSYGCGDEFLRMPWAYVTSAMISKLQLTNNNNNNNNNNIASIPTHLFHGDVLLPHHRRVAFPKAASPRLPYLFPGKHVDDGELEQRREDEDQPYRHPYVDGLDIGYARQLRTRARALRCHGEHGEESYCDASWDGVNGDPEGHPRQDDYEDAGDVELDHVVADIALQDEVDRQAWIGTCRER